MTQAQDSISAGPHWRSDLEAHTGNTDESSDWLVLADPDGPIDLARLFPDLWIRLTPDSGTFSDALDGLDQGLIVLIAPPAGPADLERAAHWLANHPGSRGVLLSSHQTVAVRLHALELGFHDAIDLSADPMEVVGRLSIAGRRPGSGLSRLLDQHIQLAPGVELDRRARAIRRDGRLTSLRPKELALLEFLAMHPGRAYSREELLEHVWHDAAANERTVDVYVFWLRSKIERDPGNPRHLVTVRGSGYLFDPPQAVTNVNKPPMGR